MAASPSMLKRARLALQVFRRGMPGAQRKSMPMAWPDWRNGIPQWQVIDLQSYIDEGFNVNSVIYSAVMYKARAITAAPLRAYGGDPSQPELLPANHPLSKLALRPNPWQSNAAFMQQATVYLNIAGNVYNYVGDRPRPGATPTAMKLLRPDRVYIVPENGGVKGYLYVPEGRMAVNAWRSGNGPKPEGVVPILPQDIMHVKLPNPGDPLEGLGYGLSPVSPLARSADVDNTITKFLQSFFQRGTNVGYMASYDRELEQSEVDRIRERWKEVYGGWDKWDELGVMDSGGKLEKLTLGFNEVGFEAMDERSEARMVAPFGVPPVLIGTRVGLKQATMANYAEARRQCWEDTIIPELQLYESEVDYYLTGQDDATFLRFDTSQVPALRQDVAKQTESAYKLWSMGVPVNQATKIVGLAIDPVPGGDVGYLPLSVQAIGKNGLPIPPKPAPLPVAPSVPGEPVVKPTGEPPAKPADQTVEGGAAATAEPRKAVAPPFRDYQGDLGRGSQEADLDDAGQDGPELGAEVCDRGG